MRQRDMLLALFDTHGRMPAECDQELERMLAELAHYDGDPGKPKRRGRQKNAPCFDVRVRLFRMRGVDLMPIDGIDTGRP